MNFPTMIRPMVRTFLVLTLTACGILPPALRAQQTPEGRWKGNIDVPGSALDVTVTLVRGAPVWSGSIDIPAQRAIGLALNAVVADDSVSFEIAGIPGRPTFSGMVLGDTMAGTFSQAGATFPFRLTRARGQLPDPTSRNAEPSPLADTIRAYIRDAMVRWKVPGVALAVIRDGEIIIAEGFGSRDVDAPQPMTGRTVMPIGSSSKSFTAHIIGTLVDEGLIEWDDPVRKHLPDFVLKDEDATRVLRVRDLLTHVSGMPRHDLVWYGARASRKELFEALRHLESSAPVRTDWQYQNLMFMTAGYLAERVTGKTWETLVSERIFTPLGMSRSMTSVAELRTATERATGYQRKNDAYSRMEYRDLDAIGPAGSISSTAEDMAKWVLLQLRLGKVDGRQLIATDVLGEIHAPQVVMPSPPTQPGGPGTLLFNLYAMGWMQHSYRGYRLLEHGGNIDGFSAMVSFMPEKNHGLVVLTNMNATGLPGAAMLTIYDMMLGVSGFDWSASALSRFGLLETLVGESREAEEALRVKGTKPSHRLEEYVGVYEHPAYGAFDVRMAERKLRGSLHGLTAGLDHYHYDVFVMRDQESPLDGLKVQFQTGMTGEIDAVTIALEPAVDPIRFERKLADGIDSARSAQLVGEYEIAGMTATVAWRAGALMLAVTGQEERELLPYMGRTFRLKDAEGYSARFEPATGRAERVLFIQPNGVFPARRKK